MHYYKTDEQLAQAIVQLVQTAGLQVKTGTAQGMVYIAVPDADERANITVRVGRPRGSYIRHPSQGLPEPTQVRITAHNAERNTWGGWSDVARAFPRRSDKTFNLAGILSAIRELVQESQLAASRRKDDEATRRVTELAKQSAMEVIDAAGFSLPYTVRGRSVRIDALSTGKVDVKITCTAHEAVALLRHLAGMA